MDKLIFPLIFALFTLFFSPSISAQEAKNLNQSSLPQTISIINQVRGDECCQPGSTDHLGLQVNTLNQLKLPATFTLRYDALINPSYRNLIPSNFDIGILIEITPSLAQAANVNYPGSLENWHKANQVFLLGYSIENRKKIIDTLMKTYKSIYGYYPTATSSWMIDAYSLNYLSSHYNLKIHQITKEQWGTDSYTLYGGPPSQPYFPSSNWPIIPTNQNKELPILIIRQTVADPLFNYGNTTASFTSQPNDYLNSGKQLWYFKTLINQMISQLPLVLGLENSMDDKYQKEFVDQLQFINQTLKHNTKFLTATQLSQEFQPSPVTLTRTRDLVKDDSDLNAFWITTTKYRLRLRQEDQNFAITDIRLYHQALTDPYLEASSSTKNAYWITPFLLDGSRYDKLPETHQNFLQEIKSWFTKGKEKPPRPKYIFNPKSDNLETNYLINLPSIDKDSFLNIDQNNIVTLTYLNQSKPIVLKFHPSFFTLTSHQSPQLVGEKTYSLLYNGWQEIQPFHWLPQIKLSNSNNHTLLSWQYQKQKMWWIDVTQDKNTYRFSPSIDKNLNLDQLRSQFPNELAPETAFAPADPIHTQVYFNNTRAIANRNPIRFLVYPRDKLGIPTKAVGFNVKSKNSQFESILIQPSQNETGQIWTDITQTNPGSHQLQIYLNNQLISTQQIRFATNCKLYPKTCLTNPIEAIRYLATQLNEFILKTKTRYATIK